MLQTEFSISKSRVGALTYLVPEASLASAATAAALETAIVSCIASHQVQIVVDMGKVTSLCGMTLEVLAKFNNRLASLGGFIKISYPSQLVLDILLATGLTEQVPVFDAPPAPRVAPRPTIQRKLGDILVEKNLISDAQVAEITELQRKTGKRIGTLLLEKKWLAEADLVKALAEQLGVPCISLRAGMYDKDAVKLLNAATARQLKIMPLFKVSDTLTVATSNPQALESFDDVKALTGCKVRVVLATTQEIDRVMDEAYGGNLLPEFVHDDADDLELIESQIPDDYTLVDEMAAASPVINLVNAVIQRAIKDSASDIHIEIARNRSRIRLRIDGLLYEVMTPRAELHPAIVSRLKVMANLDIAERRLPQDGRIQVFTQGRTVDLRFSSLPGIYGEKVVLRVLDKNQAILDIDKLGMYAGTVSLFKKLLGRSHGLLLVTGPTGSGKTTTLYSALSHLKSIETNIVTIEDPVEYQLDIINQNQVNESIGLTFARILKHVLRQDPDIVMVGEVRDRETAEIAVQAALTGHLVLTTLHTNDTLGAISRLTEMGVEPYLLSSALIGVMAQRLVRRICPACKTTYIAPPEVAASCGWPGPGDLRLARGRGCSQCYDSGYKGRLGVYELLEVDTELQRMILANAGKNEMTSYLKRAGHRDMFADGMEQVFSGNTTPEEIARVVHAQ